MKSHIANNIHAFRSNKGLSQAQLAEIADVTQGAISSWETGITIPRKSNLQPIVNAFEELTIDDFLSDKEGYAQKILRRSQRGTLRTPRLLSTAPSQQELPSK